MYLNLDSLWCNLSGLTYLRLPLEPHDRAGLVVHRAQSRTYTWIVVLSRTEIGNHAPIVEKCELTEIKDLRSSMAGSEALVLLENMVVGG